MDQIEANIDVILNNEILKSYTDALNFEAPINSYNGTMIIQIKLDVILMTCFLFDEINEKVWSKYSITNQLSNSVCYDTYKRLSKDLCSILSKELKNCKSVNALCSITDSWNDFTFGLLNILIGDLVKYMSLFDKSLDELVTDLIFSPLDQLALTHLPRELLESNIRIILCEYFLMQFVSSGHKMSYNDFTATSRDNINFSLNTQFPQIMCLSKDINFPQYLRNQFYTDLHSHVQCEINSCLASNQCIRLPPVFQSMSDLFEKLISTAFSKDRLTTEDNFIQSKTPGNNIRSDDAVSADLSNSSTPDLDTHSTTVSKCEIEEIPDEQVSNLTSMYDGSVVSSPSRTNLESSSYIEFLEIEQSNISDVTNSNIIFPEISNITNSDESVSGQDNFSKSESHSDSPHHELILRIQSKSKFQSNWSNLNRNRVSNFPCIPVGATSFHELLINHDKSEVEYPSTRKKLLKRKYSNA